MNIKICKIITYPLSLLLLVGFIFIGNGEVLCVAEDGHIEIEAECLPCCSGEDNDCKFSEEDFSTRYEISEDDERPAPITKIVRTFIALF